MLNLSKKWCQFSTTRSIFTSTKSYLDQKWREKNGLPANPNAFGPLTNLPDYHYMDGRPTPIGSNMRKRLQKQKEIAEKVVVMCNELKFAKDRFNQKKLNEQKAEEERSNRRLKQKGTLLLYKK